nr:hypothetical protein [Polaromonas sp. AER18D-145]
MGFDSRHWRCKQRQSIFGLSNVHYGRCDLLLAAQMAIIHIDFLRAASHDAFGSMSGLPIRFHFVWNEKNSFKSVQQLRM